MRFVFNAEKAVAAAAYLCEKKGRSIDLLFLLKTLYLADRKALVGWQRTITGDAMFSLKNGPILSRVYDLAKSEVEGSDMHVWNQFFLPRSGNIISMVPGVQANLGPLSQRETDALDESFAELSGLTAGQIIEKLHKELPEWVDPGQSRLPIDPRKILEFENFESEQISEFEVELSSVQSARIAFRNQ